MYILVLPVSGGGFVIQLAILEYLCEANIVPDVMLASSGGNVAAYIAAAANWKWAGIERIAREMSQTLFARPWNSVMFISMIVGYFKGNIYNKGDGVGDFLSRYFTKETIKKYEIWTGTYNKKRQQTRLFCNREKEESILDISCIDHDLTQSMEPVFTKGNMEMIAKAGVASASIPGVVPPEIIMDEEYVDGGVAGASPLTIMQEPILKYTRDNKESLHLIYVNSDDLSSHDVKTGHNLFDTLRQATEDLIRFQTVIDRLSGYELLRCQNGTINKDEFICNYENIARVKKIQGMIKYSMLEIYPTADFDIELSKFTGCDVINAIHIAYKNCKCRFWWITNEDKEAEIYDLIDQCKTTI